MRKLKLILTDPDGVVLAQWTVGRKLEEDYDIEDLEAEPECDFYLWGRWNSKESYGEVIEDEGKKWFNNKGQIEICEKCGDYAEQPQMITSPHKWHCRTCGDSWTRY